MGVPPHHPHHERLRRFPHNPHSRCWMADVDGWQVRVLAHNDPRRPACVRRGLMHLQLWHATQGISILTRSKLTFGLFEVCSAAGVVRVCCPTQLVRYLARELDMPAPSMPVVTQFERLFVHMTYLGASLHAQEDASCERSPAYC